ncbi:hypothetical protein [Actinomadura sp. NEAU-AAG7]|uniref:hypothetical protein n=1 Tax=Actinomadura sp. NEAU-AAG7 TaxID=2839640 RepID=UPI001BE49772|nr:hypothetical protein [Actinomadura sp. NEAU-AAG7]MBT2211777.1 hypothetical protein [Actinomadura sp. NEAU-AAG7]
MPGAGRRRQRPGNAAAAADGMEPHRRTVRLGGAWATDAFPTGTAVTPARAEALRAEPARKAGPGPP